MEAFSILPATASHQTAEPPGSSQGAGGLSDVFAALLQEAASRLDARPADLAFFEARRTSGAAPHRTSAAETISTIARNDDRRDDASFRADSVDDDAAAARKPAEPIAPTEVADDGIRVAAVGGSLLIGRVKPQGGKKVPAHEWAASAGLSAGSRLGT